MKLDDLRQCVGKERGATTDMQHWAELAAIVPHISIHLAIGIRSKRIKDRPSSASAPTDPLEGAFTAPSAANDQRCWGMCSLDRLLEVWHTKARCQGDQMSAHPQTTMARRDERARYYAGTT